MKKYFQKNFKKCLTSLRTSAIITSSTRLSETIKTSSFKFNYYGECQSLISELKKFERIWIKFLQRTLVDGRRNISTRVREKKILKKSVLIWVRFPLISIPLIENVVKRPLTSKTSYQIHIYVFSSRFYCGSSVEIGQVPERPKGTDCKSVIVRFRWFESTPSHFQLKISFNVVKHAPEETAGNQSQIFADGA